MDARCDVYNAGPEPLVFQASGCPQLKTQDSATANTCNRWQIAKENCTFVSGASWRENELPVVLMELILGVSTLPGNMPVTYA
jgi:hypothetical protein